MRPRERDLRPLGAPAHLEHEGADAITGIEPLARDLFALGQDRLRLADLDDDVALLDPMHDTPQDLTILAVEFLEDAIALGVPHPLQDHLLGRLGGDAAKLLGRQLLLELVAELGLRVQRLGVGEAELQLAVGDLLDDLLATENLEGARLAIDLHADVLGGAQGLARRRQQSRLQRLEEGLLVDPLFASDLLDDDQQLSVHRSRPSSPARPRHLGVQPCLGHGSPLKLHPRAVAVNHQSLGRDVSEAPAGFQPARLPQPHELAHGPAKLAIAPEQSIQSRRRNLEVVGILDQSLDVDEVTDFAAHPLAITNRHTTRLVDEHAEDRTRPPRMPFEVDELEAVVAKHRLNDFFDPDAPIFVLH